MIYTLCRDSDCVCRISVLLGLLLRLLLLLQFHFCSINQIFVVFGNLREDIQSSSSLNYENDV